MKNEKKTIMNVYYNCASHEPATFAILHSFNLVLQA